MTPVCGHHNQVVERLKLIVNGVDKNQDVVVDKRQSLNVGIMIVGKNAATRKQAKRALTQRSMERGDICSALGLA